MLTALIALPVRAHLARANAPDTIQRHTHAVWRPRTLVGAEWRAAGTRALFFAPVSDRPIVRKHAWVVDAHRFIAPPLQLCQRA